MTWPGLPGLHNKGKMRLIEVKLEGIGKCSLGKASRNRRKNKPGSVLGAGERVGPPLFAS